MARHRQVAGDRIVRDYNPDDEVMSGCLIFAGKSVNLNRLATQEGFDYSYIWRVFKGLRVPSVAYARRLSSYLHMSLDEFLAELESQKLGQAPPPQE